MKNLLIIGLLLISIGISLVILSVLLHHPHPLDGDYTCPTVDSITELEDFPYYLGYDVEFSSYVDTAAGYHFDAAEVHKPGMKGWACYYRGGEVPLAIMFISEEGNTADNSVGDWVCYNKHCICRSINYSVTDCFVHDHL